MRYLAVFSLGALAVLIGQLALQSPAQSTVPAAQPASSTERGGPTLPVARVQTRVAAPAIVEVAPPTDATAEPAARPEEDSPLPDAEHAERFADAADRVDRALARGTWTATDAELFVAELEVLSSEERVLLLSQLVPALNDGTITLEQTAAPF